MLMVIAEDDGLAYRHPVIDIQPIGHQPLQDGVNGSFVVYVFVYLCPVDVAPIVLVRSFVQFLLLVGPHAFQLLFLLF